MMFKNSFLNQQNNIKPELLSIYTPQSRSFDRQNHH